MASKKRPLVNADPVNEFGAVMADETVMGEDRASVDLTYVPGWSELRHRRDLQVAEFKHGHRLGKDVDALPVNVRWARRTKAGSQEPAAEKLTTAVNLGYRMVTKDDVAKQPWLTQLPPGARILPTGEIVNAAGDLQLTVCSAQVAARNAKRKADASAAMMDSLREDTEGLASDGPLEGASPYMRVEQSIKHAVK